MSHNRWSETMSCNCCKFIGGSFLASPWPFSAWLPSHDVVCCRRSIFGSTAASKSSRTPSSSSADDKLPIDPAASQIRPGDWNQWAGSPRAQQHARRQEHPDRLERRRLRRRHRRMEEGDRSKNIKWVARLGSQELTAIRSSPTARSSSAPTTAAAISSAIRRRSIWACCSASTRPTASSSGKIPAKSCRPAASTIGRCKASAARRWSKGIGSGTSPAAAR